MASAYGAELGLHVFLPPLGNDHPAGPRRVGDHLYDLRMDAKTFQVVRDGVPLAEERHGKSITITEQGEVRLDKSGSGLETER